MLIMSIQNPATPAQAATPGNGPQGSGTPSPVSSPAGTPTGQGNQAEGTVTISTKEFAELLRAKARSVSFEKRAQFVARQKSNTSQPMNREGGDDPELVAQLQREQEARADSDRRALRAEVTLKVRDLLDKEEFKALPFSTKALIIKNPSSLSEADNIDEALLDIEDFVREQVAGLNLPAQPQNNSQAGSRSENPAGHESPLPVSAGAPNPVSAVELEDVSKLDGVSRSRAVLRNSLKKARGLIK